MKLLLLLFTNILAFFLIRRVRRVVAVGVVCTLAFTVVTPPARAQLGIPAVIAAASQVVATINNVIGPLLSAIQGTIGAINGVLTQFRNLWEQVVYPLQSINRAKALVTSMIAQFRGILTALMRVNVSSAQLPNPVGLESIIRNRGTGDFAQLTSAFIQTYRAIPQPANAHPIERDLADIDDAMALGNLKTLKASDAVVDQMMAAADAIENEGMNMAPGSAPFLAAAGMTASVKSQAMMQRMIAAAIRQEAARLAHDNTVRKRNAMFGAQLRDDVRTIFKK
ncbi:MAG: hypothetical protein K2X03_02540 [Bryobacteraceae bacterium]|nr:hypothetical protein [Bryobacteraceae bacterium]